MASFWIFWNERDYPSSVSLVTSPNIKRVEDLKGKIVGISSFGGTPHSEVIAILRKYVMNPEKDVTFLQIGGISSRYGAVADWSFAKKANEELKKK